MRNIEPKEQIKQANGGGHMRHIYPTEVDVPDTQVALPTDHKALIGEVHNYISNLDMHIK